MNETLYWRLLVEDPGGVGGGGEGEGGFLTHVWVQECCRVFETLPQTLLKVTFAQFMPMREKKILARATEIVNLKQKIQGNYAFSEMF